MTPLQAISLIQEAVTADTKVWADLGAGSGTFTFALDSLLGFEGTIYAIDRKLAILREEVKRKYARGKIHLLETDFKKAAKLLPKLDGVLMANALHYVQDQVAFLQEVSTLLKNKGSLIVIEYDREDADQWVPYPVSIVELQRLALKSGFGIPEEIGRIPSIYQGRELYAATCRRLD